MTTANKTYSLDTELLTDIGKAAEKENISESAMAEKLLKYGVKHVENCIEKRDVKRN